MAIAPQYLRGSTRAEMVPFDQTDATVTFADGDLVYEDASGYAQPQGSVTITTNFLGAAAQRKPAGTTGTAKRLLGNSTDGLIRVDHDGVWAYDRTDTVALSFGDLLAPTGTTTVAKTSTESISVGRVAEAVAAGATRVKMKIQSGKYPAGRIA